MCACILYIKLIKYTLYIFFSGAVHSGNGSFELNKILACLNIPTLSQSIYQRYEREVGPAIELAAKESCNRAASEERSLVISRIDELCDRL